MTLSTLKRSKLETCIEVLKDIYLGETKSSRIQNHLNLNPRTLRNITRVLLDQRLIKVNENFKGSRRLASGKTSQLYSITKKGQNILRYFEKIDSQKNTKPMSANKYFLLRQLKNLNEL